MNIKEKGCCFIAGTKISMFDGSYKDIENIIVGDAVMSFDINNNLIQGNVTQLIQYNVAALTTLSTSSEILKTTPEHKFRVGNDFLRVDQLMRGNKLLLLNDGVLLNTTLMSSITTTGSYTVYNFIVDGPETYFANNIGVA